MLDRSFVMLPSIGSRIEAKLWSQGIVSWSQFIEAEKVVGISMARLKHLQEIAGMISELKAKGRMRELGYMLPAKERWRLLSGWNESFAAIDVEVSAAGQKSYPVILTVCRGQGICRTLIRGDDLCWHSFDKLLKGADFLVTYNGSSFDIPLLTRHGYRVENLLHLDLRRYSRRVGLIGGLKEIESQLDIRRSIELEFTTSEQISYLWRCWEKRGRKRALDLLISYNQQDTKTLLILAKQIYYRLMKRSIEKGNSNSRERAV